MILAQQLTDLFKYLDTLAHDDLRAFKGIPNYEPLQTRLESAVRSVLTSYNEHRTESLIRFFITSDLPQLMAFLKGPVENFKHLPTYLPWGLETTAKEMTGEAFKNFRCEKVMDFVSCNSVLNTEELLSVIDVIVGTKDLSGHQSHNLVYNALTRVPAEQAEEFALRYGDKHPTLIVKYCRQPEKIDAIVHRIDLTSADVLRCKYLSKETLAKVVSAADGHADRDKLATNPLIGEKLLYKWAKSTKRDNLLCAIAKNVNCTELTLGCIIKNPNVNEAIKVVCRHPNVTKQLLTSILIMPNKEFRAAAQEAMKKFETKPKEEPKKKDLFASFMKVI